MNKIKSSWLVFIKSGKINIFFLFLFFSTILWSLAKLSKEYSSNIEFNIQYENVPKDKILLGNPPAVVSNTITASGFRLLKYKLAQQTIRINLSDAPQKKQEYVIHLNDKANDIHRQFSDKVTFDQFYPEILNLSFGYNKEKEVKVQLDLDLNFKNGYNLKESVVINPNIITVFGREDLVDSLAILSTEKIEFKRLESDFNIMVPLVIPNQFKTLTFSHKEVEVSATVDKFTEGRIKIPVKVIHIPKNTSLKLFPNKVEVLYVVNLSRFNEVAEEDFEVIVDYAEALKRNESFLTPKLLCSSNIVTSYKLAVDKIDFLVKK